ncbi:MAG: hypothetical protein EXR86_08785 [Gammaproteobacteria bacterium]|nr:hypothetical protein [Gammaproteobacteria bacterium]
MPKSSGWIVKLGGSLALSPELPAWLAQLTSREHGCVIVPGGGRFVEFIDETQTQWAYSEAAAHCMALLAMAQYGLMLHAMEPRLRLLHDFDEVREALSVSGAGVWIPRLEDVERMTDLPQDWSVSADSIALWLAGRSGAAGLCLVKARAPSGVLTSSALAEDTYVDAHFPTVFAAVALPVVVFAKHEIGEIAEGSLAVCARTCIM